MPGTTETEQTQNAVAAIVAGTTEVTNNDDYHVPAAVAAKWSAVWIAGMLAFTLSPYVFGAYAYDTYLQIRNGAIVLLPILAAFGIAIAWKFIGGKKNDPPWYTSGFLVALVVFWAIWPPTWFFVEYLLFEIDKISLPSGIHKKDFLTHIKAYADLASKIWTAVGAALGGAIAAARK